MKLPFRFHRETLFLFLAGSVLFFLSSRYFGGIYIRLSRFWFTFFFLDILILIINQLTIRYSLDFSSDHMSKGDLFRYTITVQGSPLLPIPHLSLQLAQVHEREDEGGELIHLALKPGELWTYSRERTITLRGVYTMGISRLNLASMSGLVSLELPVKARNFYVYPRIIDIGEILSRHSASGGRSLGLEGRGGEAHSFLGLREYRNGEGLKHISWSRYMQTGRPYVKEYSSEGGSEIHLFLDRRGSGRSAICDDTVLEVFLCLLNSGLNTGQTIILHGYPGWEGRCIESQDEFKKLYATTLLFEFDGTDLEELREIPSLDSVYAVSAMPDFTLLDENSPYSELGHLICVTLSFPPDEEKRFRSFFAGRKQQGAVLTEIKSDHSLKDELLCRLYS